MVDRMLFQNIFDQFRKKPLVTPVAVGWNPLGSGAIYMHRLLGGPTFDTDKKHWDWTFPHWLLFDTYVTLVGLAGWPAWRRKLAYMRFEMLFERAVFSFPDGSLVAQRGKGIMKSGCYLTLLLNSLGQWFLHELCQLRLGVDIPMVCFGDDVTQKSTEFDQYFVEFYESLGFKLEASRHEFIEFCGFKIFSMNRFVPAYKDKHVFMLKHLTEDPVVATQTLQSYQYIYWFDKPFLAMLRDIAARRGLASAIVPDDQLMRVVYGR
uniref:RNA-directed RNA polymerase C-terminal domain-containing protein n=1 Tax=Solemoviridae sp. TaxID=2715208 RepID=A0A6M3YPL0_9VIRU|nr:MAG: hypothetical protein 2 [Solemoviridae sp.]